MRKTIAFEIFVECLKCGWEGKVKVKGFDEGYDLPECPKCGAEELQDVKIN